MFKSLVKSIGATGVSPIATVAGGVIQDQQNQRQAQQNYKQQKEFAQHGIRWKVADAKAAGLHPLAALGAQTSTFAPTVVGGGSSSSDMGNFGQNLNNAIDSTRTQNERIQVASARMQSLALERASLENDLLRARIASEQALSRNNPPMPSLTANTLDGQGNSPLVSAQPMEVTATRANNRTQEPGAVPSVGFAQTPSGYMPVKSSDATERLEDDMLGNLAWNVRNRLLPSFGAAMNPPPLSALPEGFDTWGYNPFKQEYYPARKIWGPLHW